MAEEQLFSVATVQPTSQQGDFPQLEYKRLYARFHKRIDNLNFLNKSGSRFENPETNLDYTITEPLEVDLINITINRNLNNISQSANIDNIYHDEFFDLFTKYDRVEVFVLGEDDVEYIIFDGELINKNSNRSLDEDSISFELLDNLNLLNRINVPYPAKGKNIHDYLVLSFLEAGLLPTSDENKRAVALTGLNTYIPIVTQLDNPNIAHFKPSGNFMNYLSQIRKNYPFYVFGDRLARLNVSLPDFMYSNQLTVWEIDLAKNSAYITVSNAFSLVNLIITIGYSAPENRELQYGWAFDSINYSMNGGKINYRIEYAFDVFGYPELSKLASNILIKENKNFKIDITNLPFYHGYDVGDFIKIKNHPTINPEQVFFIEDLKHNLSIDSFNTTITASSFALGIVPENITLGQRALDPLINIELGKSFRVRE
jgi:hypothetical protein